MSADRGGWTPDWVPDALAELKSQGLYRTRRVLTRTAGGSSRVDGSPVLNFAGNDYLGLSTHPAVISAAEKSIRLGVGAGASSLVYASDAQHRCEEELANFEGEEAALVFPTGYAANTGVIAASVGRGDVVFCDRENHACVIDGCRLSGARFRIYRRDRLDRLADDLARHASARRRLIATDGVFSMDGTLAPLAELKALSGEHDAVLLVDEAHGSGILGAGGRGACEAAGLLSGAEPVDRLLRTGTLSKAFGAAGGFVTGSRPLIDYLRNAARTQMFSTAVPPAITAAAAEAVRLVRTGGVRWNTELERPIRRWIEARGLQQDAWRQAAGPIHAVLIGDDRDVVRYADELRGLGVFIAAIRPPTVPRGTARLRISLSRHHSAADVEQLIACLDRVIPT